ncbi:serine/arginine-rich splicing factor SC35-like [Magnolia sinica]|uniref:serine/arginine-rich splicing factor SC35-like n=1 Tax=Magnolia sinica TaxID=86752 RepID=UPI002658BF15|nr:serine/arginine-rich splicing factor SC35-like [Magnolia sinica]
MPCKPRRKIAPIQHCGADCPSPSPNGRGKHINSRDFSLFIRNITFDTSMEDLFQIFIKFGKVIDMYILKLPGTLKLRGYGFARFRYEQEAKNATDVLNGKRIDGRIVEIRWA